jgi:hypothetical protein
VPEEHATVVTPHKWAIRFLEWAPATLGGPLLLSADHEKICIWEMKDNVTEWGEDEPASRAKKPIKILDFEGTVGLKWLNADPKVSNHTGHAAVGLIVLANAYGANPLCVSCRVR